MPEGRTPAGPQQPDALTFQRPDFKTRRVPALRDIAKSGRGFRVLQGVTRQHVEGHCRVAHVAGNRPDDISCGARLRDDSGVRNQAKRGFDAHHALRTRRVLNRAAGFFSQPHHGKIRRDSGARTGGRSPGRP